MNCFQFLASSAYFPRLKLDLHHLIHNYMYVRKVRPVSILSINYSTTVIRRFTGNLDIVHVGFGETCVGDFDELAILAHGCDVTVSGVAHRRSEAAHELVQDMFDWASCGNSPFDAFWDILACVSLLGLEIPVMCSLAHGSYASHATVHLV